MMSEAPGMTAVTVATFNDELAKEEDAGKELNGGLSEKANLYDAEKASADIDKAREMTEASNLCTETCKSQSDDYCEKVTDDEKKQSLRVQIRNIPQFFKYKQVKEMLSKHLSKFKVKNIRHVGTTVFLSLPTPEEAITVVNIFDGLEIKGRILRSSLARPQPPKVPPSADLVRRTARERVTPLADKLYHEQLEIKMHDVKRTAASLLKEMKIARVHGVNKIGIESLIKPIHPSPRITGYRNKCEFTAGHSIDGDICVGFVGGKFAANQHYILSPDTCDNISSRMKRVVEAFQGLIIESGEAPFNEFERKGVWKMLSIREFGMDMMIIVTIYPMQDKERENVLIKMVKDKFIQSTNTLNEKNLISVTSLYWQRLANASDPVNYEFIAGLPYIYENVLNVRFRVSPSSFFQTNSFGAAVLYKVIAEQCGLCITNNAGKAGSSNIKTFPNKDCGGELCDGLKTSVEVGKDNEKQVTVVLDICCGTGTIGITLMKLGQNTDRKFLLGVDISPEAIEDARMNAKDNKISPDSYGFISAKAEEVFHRLERVVPKWVNLNTANIVGVIDPPRAGVHEKVIIGCRALPQLKRIVFVSCNPWLAMKNMVDICRSTSRKFEGEPFKLISITPVDMFPQTRHCEWVVRFER
ncbi:unnamed protein product [Thelazia callipaeda]|uniref:tRNA (uracil(54)-C(5))-methyltransferase n=1 Tax=Thelazia callipaeda TaxID=103827 RepID=A0A0N5CVG9_THECL|nr:unnamed protein product [Thelazia callipaeda]